MFAHVEIEEVVTGLYQFANFTRGKCLKYLSKCAVQLEAYMKQEAVWRNRTHNARDLLTATVYEEFEKGVETTPAVVGIKLSHGVPYGVWLEYRRDYEDKYSIFIPTLNVKGPEVIRNMRNILSALDG